MTEHLKKLATSMGLLSASIKGQVTSSGSFWKKPTAAQSEPWILRQGVTGADSSIPVFDGTSLDPHDFLIDLESDSMERYPDIRSCFHLVGEFSQTNPTTPPSDLVSRISYDDDLVRQGRLFLKAAKARGLR